MKVTIEGSEIRIHGSRGVDLRIYANVDKDLDRFSMSLCYDGMQHSCLPMVEVSGGHIVTYNTLAPGKSLLK